MSPGKCNLILIKTCCWHCLHTDTDLQLSSPHFSSTSSIILFFFCWSSKLWLPHIFYLIPSLAPFTSCPSSYLLLFLLLSVTYIVLFSSWFFLFHCSPTTTRRKSELSAGKLSSSTTTSWRQRSPLISSERTMWVNRTTCCKFTYHRLLRQCCGHMLLHHETPVG